MRSLSSWGRLSREQHEVIELSQPTLVASVVAKHLPGVAYGMGRSYGDACLNPNGVVWSTAGLNHLITFERDSGELRCEAGVLLRDIQRLVVPEGWMLPVTPGTQLITVGGAIANDVHGKNHHLMGSFGDHVKEIKLLRTNGEIIICGPTLQADLFAATLGGIGLTGIILEARIQLRQVPGPWLETETLPYGNLTQFFELADQSEANWEHTVSWIDCLAGKSARGLFMRGNHQEQPKRIEPPAKMVRMRYTPPISLINPLTLRLFNEAYYQMNKHKSGRVVTHYQPFFYPLDNVQNWNRIYGPKGFYQYQSVVPRDVGQEVVMAMLAEIGRAGQGSFLAVLKTFGDRQSMGMLSFPRPGVTLALDFPNKGGQTIALLEKLDSIVEEAKGRVYLAKDACMTRRLFETGYPRLEEFMKYRDPGISSAMSRRLMGS